MPGWVSRVFGRANVAAQPGPPSPPGIAKACEQNLRKTLEFGGRSLFPGGMELKAMVVRTGAGGARGRADASWRFPTEIRDSTRGLGIPPWVQDLSVGSGPPHGFEIPPMG